MNKKNIEILRSETWDGDDFLTVRGALDDAINEFISENAEIVNIEMKERNGSFRFWIYFKC